MTKPRSAVRGLWRAFVNNDSMERFRILRRVARFLVPQYRMKWPNMEWWEDRLFTQYLVKFNEVDGLNTDRRWMMHQLLRLCNSVSGDTAECGVYFGAGSYLMALHNAQQQPARKHLVFDSFEGLSTPTGYDGDYWRAGDLCAELRHVKTNLATFGEQVQFYPGWIPQSFEQVDERQYAFVHIDVDLYQPTRDSIEYFYPRLAPGGILLCDDYGLTTCPGASRAMDEFFDDKVEKTIAPSGGSGFIVKGIDVAPVLRDIKLP